jgi:hypothetical protein
VQIALTELVVDEAAAAAPTTARAGRRVFANMLLIRKVCYNSGFWVFREEGAKEGDGQLESEVLGLSLLELADGK